jgi:membrane-bound metal-dependent hydrolase YbcI (DUF457 family)
MPGKKEFWCDLVMTQVGHTLTGAAIGVLCLPRGSSATHKAIHIAAFALLANLPDLPFPGWSHDRYEISHSLFVNVLLIVLVAAGLFFMPRARAGLGGWQVAAAGALAWLSHLLLDTFYNHGGGLAMFWPVSEARLAFPIAWFSIVQGPPFPITPATWRIFAIEFAAYLPALLLAILFKARQRAR